MSKRKNKRQRQEEAFWIQKRAAAHQGHIEVRQPGTRTVYRRVRCATCGGSVIDGICDKCGYDAETADEMPAVQLSMRLR